MGCARRSTLWASKAVTVKVMFHLTVPLSVMTQIHQFDCLHDHFNHNLSSPMTRDHPQRFLASNSALLYNIAKSVYNEREQEKNQAKFKLLRC
jgi:hypothetical protein